MQIRPTYISQLVRLTFGLSMYLDSNFGLRLSLIESLSPNWRSLDLAIRSAKSVYFFDLSLNLDRTLAQRKAQRKAKSKVKVT